MLTSKEGIENLTVNATDEIDRQLPPRWEDGTYPQGKTLAIVTRSKQSEAARKFFNFIASDKGREVLVRLGHLVDPPR